MKGFIQQIKDREEKSKQYKKEKDELDKKHGKYRSPAKKTMHTVLGVSVKTLLLVACIPIVAGTYLIASNEYMSIYDSSNTKFEELVSASLERSSECLDLDGAMHPDEKRTCLVSQMKHGDTFLGDALVVFDAKSHAIDTNDKELAESIMGAIEWMEKYRHYDDINFDLEIGRGMAMILQSIIFAPIRSFLSDDLSTIQKDTFVDKKMDALDETRTELREFFDI